MTNYNYKEFTKIKYTPCGHATILSNMMSME